MEKWSVLGFRGAPSRLCLVVAMGWGPRLQLPPPRSADARECGVSVWPWKWCFLCLGQLGCSPPGGGQAGQTPGLLLVCCWWIPASLAASLPSWAQTPHAPCWPQAPLVQVKVKGEACLQAGRVMAVGVAWAWRRHHLLDLPQTPLPSRVLELLQAGSCLVEPSRQGSGCKAPPHVGVGPRLEPGPQGGGHGWALARVRAARVPQAAGTSLLGPACPVLWPASGRGRCACSLLRAGPPEGLPILRFVLMESWVPATVALARPRGRPGTLSSC